MAEGVHTSEYDYHLPEHLIASESVEPRDSSRLMVIDRAHATIGHRRFNEIGEFLRPGDLLVVNDSKVFKCRLAGQVGGKTIELFLLREHDSGWLALARPGKILGKGSRILLPDNVEVRVENKHPDGTLTVAFPFDAATVFAYTEKFGEVPLPPYIRQNEKAAATYQTAYARAVGSAAAPTAGFHFTERLLGELEARGVRRATITLHVGLGTFQPIKTEHLGEHTMHEEFFEIPEATKQLVRETRERGGRIVAVGTTSLRALESWAAGKKGSTDLFITPGYEFKVVDALVTNFHLPKSTLLVLVRTFGGSELMVRAYEEAIRNDYRFYSFGDAMLIV